MNQNPEQIARDRIDAMLQQAGWVVQDKNQINHNAGKGIAIREYLTNSGPVDYALFINRQPVGIIEAKKEEEAQRISVVENQTEGYASSGLKYFDDIQIPFIYESTSTITRFRDTREKKSRSRLVFGFHKPEVFKEWLEQDEPLRDRLHHIPILGEKEGYLSEEEEDKLADLNNLRLCQFRAIRNLEQSFKDNKPRALVQMATGSGKTFTAITSIYRLLKYAKAKRILFLVDTRNLGEQAEQEFMAYTPADDNRKFTELYNVQRLQSSYISPDSHVVITTIQRLYSILKGEELDEAAEEENPNENRPTVKEPVPVVYNPKVPPEFFDFIVIDECHRSIYNLWKQVLDYFDAFLVGLTATPDKRTFGFFHENVVSEYSHEDAVADGVNVGYDVYLIETKITKQGAKIKAKEYVEKRERLTRRKRWEQPDEDIEYSGKQLDKDVVNPSVIRNVIRTFKQNLPEIFPQRNEIPKTLIFAKTDSHADDIIDIVREEFGEGNSFCKKVTYNAQEDPKSVLAQFRNEYNPRIAVTVDMIATGTDVKPLECLLFMRDVKSRNYFEQMKGRGTRTLGYDDLKKVTPSVNSAKTHFVIVDAIGVTKSLKTDSRPLERKPSFSLKELMSQMMMGVADEDTFTSLANRLSRLDKQITDDEKERVKELTEGKAVTRITHELLSAFDPDKIEEEAKKLTENWDDTGFQQKEELKQQAQEQLKNTAFSTFTGPLIDYLENVRKMHEQYIDEANPDEIEFAGWNVGKEEKAQKLIETFREFISQHKDEITALRIFYDQPYNRRDITYKMIKDVREALMHHRPPLAPLKVWHAYEQLGKANGQSPKNELTALVALLRHITNIDPTLTTYEQKVNENFKQWIFEKNAGQHKRFTEAQMAWLRMIRDHIASSYHLEKEDLDYAPFDAQGGIGGMYQEFGEEIEEIIGEMNEKLSA